MESRPKTRRGRSGKSRQEWRAFSMLSGRGPEWRESPASKERRRTGVRSSHYTTARTLPSHRRTLPSRSSAGSAPPPRVPMALASLCEDEQRIVFTQMCNVLDPGIAVALSSVSNELRTATQALLPPLKADHEVAAVLCRKVGLQSCKELREAEVVAWCNKGLTAADLGLLGTLSSVLPACVELILHEPAAGPDGMQRLAEGLGAGALPAVTLLAISMEMGDAGASALAAALGQGALPRLKSLCLCHATITDAGLVALAPALRQRPALELLDLRGNPFGDEGLAALLAPPPAGVLPSTTGGLAKLKRLMLSRTQVTDAGCATLAAALDSGALPALEKLVLGGTPASAAARDRVIEALAKRVMSEERRVVMRNGVQLT